MFERNASQDQPGARYILPRNESEKQRLNGQHEIILAAVYGGRIIYDTAVKLEAGSCVLDSGTGTGVWLLDLAQHVSNCVELYGNDVSSIHFPKVHPQNVQFHVASVTKLPDDWTAKFDLIHQRLLIGALTAGHWQEAISEMLKVLKPGGSVQLVEFHLLDTTNAGPAWTRFRVIFEKLLAKRNMMSDCAVQLPHMLNEGGFVDVVATRKVISIGGGAGQIGKTAAAYIMIGFQSMGPAMLVEGLVASELEFEELMADVRRECDGPVHMEQAVWMVCARKPL